MRRSTVMLLGIATAVFVVTLLIAGTHDVAAWEKHLIVWVNDAPDWVAAMLWPVMQLGTLWVGAVGVGLVAAIVYGPKRGCAVLVSGVAAWYFAKVVKHVVERGRPIDFISGIDARGGRNLGFGYVSGHTAVAFAVATALMPALPRWARVVAYLLATGVGIARMVYGVHFPIDVIGGAALGIMCACVVELALSFVTWSYAARVAASSASKRLG